MCRGINKMKKIISIACGLLLVASMAVNAESQPVQELESLLAPIKSLKANFNQTVFNEKNKILQKASGNLEFKKPNLFRWQVILPEANLVVTDGKKLWNYDTDLEQVTVQDFTASDEVSPVSFLFDDVSKLATDFTIIKINEKSSACHKLASNCFKLTPKKDNPNFANVEVGFEGTQIKVLRLLDHLAQTSVFEFKQVKNNPTIATSRFTFTPPPGVDVIGEI
jgi:outer membrane lipoprotein carrier protein